jgi:hypothetical protein
MDVAAKARGGGVEIAATRPGAMLRELRCRVVGCVNAYLDVGPSQSLAQLVVDYAFALEYLLEAATGGNRKVRSELGMWLGRLAQRCDSDALTYIPWCTGPGSVLVQFLVEQNWPDTHIMRRPCDMVPDFRRDWLDPAADPEKDRHCFVSPFPVVLYEGAYVAAHPHLQLSAFLDSIARNKWFYVSGDEKGSELAVRYPRGIGISLPFRPSLPIRPLPPPRPHRKKSRSSLSLSLSTSLAFTAFF